jgi:hypothetical protein
MLNLGEKTSMPWDRWEQQRGKLGMEPSMLSSTYRRMHHGRTVRLQVPAAAGKVRTAAHLDHAVQVGHGERLVALILPHKLLVASNLLRRRQRCRRRMLEGKTLTSTAAPLHLLCFTRATPTYKQVPLLRTRPPGRCW